MLFINDSVTISIVQAILKQVIAIWKKKFKNCLKFYVVKHRIVQAQHPAYSPQLVLSNFFLFHKLKFFDK